MCVVKWELRNLFDAFYFWQGWLQPSVFWLPCLFSCREGVGLEGRSHSFPRLYSKSRVCLPPVLPFYRLLQPVIIIIFCFHFPFLNSSSSFIVACSMCFTRNNYKPICAVGIFNPLRSPVSDCELRLKDTQQQHLKVLLPSPRSNQKECSSTWVCPLPHCLSPQHSLNRTTGILCEEGISGPSRRPDNELLLGLLLL
jgi:hypothetical protein